MTTLTAAAPRLRFDLPPELEAHEPPEASGLGRDQVRLMVAFKVEQRLEHSTFPQIAGFLRAGDVLVLNTSATIPAALSATRGDGGELALHLSTRLPDYRGSREIWVAELRLQDGIGTVRFSGGQIGDHLALPGGATASILDTYPQSHGAAPHDGSRLWTVQLLTPQPLLVYLGQHGGPIRYSHVSQNWPLSYCQNVYVTEPGSAEMPSAGRAFTPEILASLESRGILLAHIILHTGVSSLEADESPYSEWLSVPPETARLVNEAHQRHARVVAVGTTVVRALESATEANGLVRPFQGWTDLVITPERGVKTVDGLLTGWHTPEASHLLMLEAIAGRTLLERAYREALEDRYRWHEFGDLELILP